MVKVKRVKKKKPSKKNDKKNDDVKKNKSNHKNDKKNGKAVIPPLKLKLSPHKSGQKYLIQKSDQKSRKARTRIGLPWLPSAINAGSTILKYFWIIKLYAFQYALYSML